MSAAVAQAIRGMLAAGLTLDQALLAIEKMDEAKRGAAKSNAERQAAWRARRKAARTASQSSNANAYANWESAQTNTSADQVRGWLGMGT